MVQEWVCTVVHVEEHEGKWNRRKEDRKLRSFAFESAYFIYIYMYVYICVYVYILYTEHNNNTALAA